MAGTNSHHRRDLARRRRSERGAALVEALVAIPFFIIIFAATLFMENLYGEKTRTMREARATAWANASSACSGGSSSGGGAIEEAGDIDLEDASGAPGTELTSSELGNASASANANASGSAVIGALNVSIKSDVVVACNEERRGTGLRDVVGYIFNVLSPL